MRRWALALAGGLLLGTASAWAAPMPEAPVVAPAPAPAPIPTPAVAPVAVKQPTWLKKDKPAAQKTLATRQGPSPLRVGGMLLLVATLGGVAFYARKKKQIKKQAMPKGRLEVLGTTRVGPKASAVVVEIGGKRILLGVTEHAVSTLAWLDDERDASVEVSEESQVSNRPGLKATDDVAAAGPSGFLRLLRNAVGSDALPVSAPVDEVVRATKDEVKLSRRSEPRAPSHDTEAFEGQVMGLAKRRKEMP